MDGTVLDDPAVVAVRRIALDLANEATARWGELVAATPEQRATGGAASEALHDYRVAVRTLRSWLRAHTDMLDVPPKTRRRLRTAANATSGARDAEVLATWLLKVPAPTRRSGAAARWWSERLVAEAHDDEVIERSGRDIDRALAGVIDAVSTIRWEQPLAQPWHFPSLAADLAPRVRAQADVLRRRIEAITDGEAIEAQHRARLAAKNLRYLFEPIESQLPEAKLARKQLKALQDALGDLRDLRTARASLAEAVDARARDEAEQRSREVLASASEHRVARRIDSLLSGFTTLAAMLHEAGDDGYRAVYEQWLADGAAELFGAVEAAAAALEARGRVDLALARNVLLRGAPQLPPDAVQSVVVIDQGYLPGRRIGERVRRVTEGDDVRYVRTVKMGRGLARTEVEEEIDVELFARMWPLTEGRRLRKQRTTALDDRSRAWEIDEFLDRPLVLAEIELTSVDDDATPPPWIDAELDRDVTDESEFSNAKLAR